MDKFDAIIIGVGQAGNPLAKKLAKAGWKVAVIEKGYVGGTCINYGCTPTKAMIASAKLAWMAKKSGDLGIDIPKYKVDFKKVMKRKQDMVERFRNSVENGLNKLKNIKLIHGQASFIDDYTIDVLLEPHKNLKITAPHIFINTGLETAVPDIEGIEDVNYLTSDEMLHLKKIPEELIIVGGGYIALEFGQMFNRFGTKVTILEDDDVLLKHEDPDIAAEVLRIFKEEGIRVLTGVEVVKLSAAAKKQTNVHIKKRGKKTEVLTSAHVLLATGRKPQTSALKLENTGIKTDEKGFIKVNDKLQTSVKNIYALGDVKGGPAFTHIAYNDHLVITENLLQQGKASTKNRPVPYCMFIDPQLGRIGITEEQAKKDKIDYKVATLPVKYASRAIEIGETNGLMKAVVDAKTSQILGASILAPEGGEVMSVLQMAMLGKLTYKQIRKMVFAHPLHAESLNNLFMSLDEGR